MNHQLNQHEALQFALRQFAFGDGSPIEPPKPLVLVLPPVTGREAPTFFSMLEAA